MCTCMWRVRVWIYVGVQVDMFSVCGHMGAYACRCARVCMWACTCACACGHVRCVHACVGVYRGPLALPPAGPPLAWSRGPCSQAPGSEALLGPSDVLPATPGHLLPAWPSLPCPSRAPTPPQAVRGHQWGPGGLPRGWGLLPAPERWESEGRRDPHTCGPRSLPCGCR